MISFDYYRIFYYVAKYNSFSKAAEMLGNNQPNITRCIKLLEGDLDCKLFTRSNKGAALTPEGQKLFDHVKIAYEHLVFGEEELRQEHDPFGGTIRIGASESAIKLYLVDKIEVFKNTFPNIKIKLSSYTSGNAVDDLEKGLIDFGVVSTPVHINQKFRMRTITSFKESLIAGPKYKDMIKKEPYHLKDLMKYPFICLGSRTTTREHFIKYFYENGIFFKPDIETSTLDTIMTLISHNIGISFVPEIIAKAAIEQGMASGIPIVEPAPERKICLITDSTRSLSPACRKLIELLK